MDGLLCKEGGVTKRREDYKMPESLRALRRIVSAIAPKTIRICDCSIGLMDE